jgi:hypothetical protein
MNNFYNEPAPTKYLDDMGSVIPIPAFPICMSAILCVRLGNRYGISYDAQRYAVSILKRVSRERWLYFLTDCLKADDRVLYKLMEDNPAKRWMEVVREFSLAALASRDVTNRTVRQLVVEAEAGKRHLIYNLAAKLIEQLGFEAK